MYYVCMYASLSSVHWKSVETMTNLVINELPTIGGLQIPFPKPSWKMANTRSGIGTVQEEHGLYCDTR